MTCILSIPQKNDHAQKSRINYVKYGFITENLLVNNHNIGVKRRFTKFTMNYC